MMHWDRLINDKRLGLEDYHDPKSGSRSDFQRDFDRLVFSSPFRRLQNKTQVSPPWKHIRSQPFDPLNGGRIGGTLACQRDKP